MIQRLIPERLRSFEAVWSEVWNVFKFGVVGVSSLFLNGLLYALFSRVLWPTGPRTPMSILAVGLASIYNFALHRRWTFKARGFNTQMLVRYLVVMVVGTSLQGTFFYIGHDLLHFYDFAVLIVSAFLIAIVTYSLHRWYTFHPKHSSAVNG